MDAACSLSQSNVLYGSEVAGCGALERLNLSTGLKYKCISRSFFGDLQLHSKTISTKKSKKNSSRCVSSSSPRTLFDDNHCLQCYSSRGSSLYNNLIDISKCVGLLRCQGSESVAYLNGNGRDAEVIKTEDESGLESNASGDISEKEELEAPNLDELKEALQKALKDLEVARLSR